MAMVPEVLADLSGPLGGKFWGKLLNSDLVCPMCNNVRDIHDIIHVSDKAMSNVPPEIWKDRAFRANEGGASRKSDAEVLPAHDAATMSSHKAQHKLGQQVNRVRYQRHVSSLKQLP